MELLVSLSALLLIVLVGFFGLLIAVLILREVIWGFSPLFFLVNYFIWFSYNPLRVFMKDKDRSSSHVLFNFLYYTLLVPLYFIVVHILLTPLRIITALYFDVLFYASVMLSDSVSELLFPRLRGMRNKTGSAYAIAYIVGFPWRLIRFLVINALTLLDMIFMFSMGVVLPTLTMYHGTDFNQAVSDIAQRGRWRVGSGDYAGLGVYFGIQKRTAEHYSNGNKGLIVVRATLNFTRNAASLNQAGRRKIGNDGVSLSHSMSSLWVTIEHWRVDLSWWEYCLIHKGRIGDYIKTWRIRPVAFIGDDGKLKRLWGGQVNYSTNSVTSFFMGSICTSVLLPFIAVVLDVYSLFLN